MQAFWTGTGRACLKDLSDRLAAQVELEVKILFADAIPGHAMVKQDGTLSLGLPCGAKVRFDRAGDGVRVFWIEDGKG